MMKKLLLSIFLFSASYAVVMGQCTPDPMITQPGIYPDSATGLPDGYVSFPYNAVVQARIPVDTIYQGFTVPITDFRIDSINGLPASFTYACSPGTCIFPGGSNGCILISGTPGAVGTYNLAVFGQATGIVFGNTVSLPFELDYYKIEVFQSGVGIPTIASYDFTLSQNEPNPFSTFSNLNYTSPASGIATFKVFNLIGKEVYYRAYQAVAGQNTINIDARDFDSGVYVYTLSLGDKTITKRMVITNK